MSYQNKAIQTHGTLRKHTRHRVWVPFLQHITYRQKTGTVQHHAMPGILFRVIWSCDYYRYLLKLFHLSNNTIIPIDFNVYRYYQMPRNVLITQISLKYRLCPLLFFKCCLSFQTLDGACELQLKQSSADSGDGAATCTHEACHCYHGSHCYEQFQWEFTGRQEWTHS